MSNQKSLFKLGDQVRIVDSNQVGTIIKLDSNNQPEKVLVGKETINVIDKVIEHLSSLIAVWRFIRNIFKF